MFLNLLLSPPSFSERAKVEMLFSRVHYSAALHYTNPNTQILQTNVIDLQKLIELENNGLLEQYFKEQFFHPDREDLLVFRLNIKFTDYSLNPPDDVEKEFISNSEQYFLLYPKRDFEGKGAVTAAHRKFSTQCLTLLKGLCIIMLAFEHKEC